MYRQSVEAITHRKLNIVQNANGDIAAAEEALDDGQIEEAIAVAEDELRLVHKMVEWKAYVPSPPISLSSLILALVGSC